MKIVKAAAVQISPVLYSRDGTVEKIVRKILVLGEQGVQFATFPETVVPNYPYFAFIQTPYQLLAGREHQKLLEEAVTVPSASTDAISEACRQAEVVASIGIKAPSLEGYSITNGESTPTHQQREDAESGRLIPALNPTFWLINVRGVDDLIEFVPGEVIGRRAVRSDTTQ